MDVSNDDLDKKISEWVEKQGYPLEFKVAMAFRRHGFTVEQGKYYDDIKEETRREIDVVAIKSRDEFEKHRTVAIISFVVECKYSKEKPWIVFTSPYNRFLSGANIAHAITTDLGQAVLWCLGGEKEVSSNALFRVPDRLGFNAVQALQGNGNESVYSALKKVISMAHAKTKINNNAQDKITSFPFICELVIPVVVIDGILFEAYYDEQANNLKIERTPNIRLFWGGSDLKWFHSIDIVSSLDLNIFLNRMNAATEQLIDHMLSQSIHIKNCVERDEISKLKKVPSQFASIREQYPPLINSLLTKMKKRRRVLSKGI